MRREKRCYLSGAITGVLNYKSNFKYWEEQLHGFTGWTIVNPAKVNAGMPDNTAYDEYMEICETLMSMCDRIFLMPGWENSRGASYEKQWAAMHGLKIYVSGGKRTFMEELEVN